ncbi:MAG: hypothetical protein WA941_19690 [Nitrososphaeraceae archaeon]
MPEEEEEEEEDEEDGQHVHGWENMTLIEEAARTHKVLGIILFSIMNAASSNEDLSE